MSDEEKKRAAQWVLNLHRECASDAAKDSWLDAPGNAERRLLHKLAEYAGWDREVVLGRRVAHLTYLLGIAAALHRDGRTPSFVVAPDVWDQLLAEVPTKMRDAAPRDPETLGLYTPGGYVVVRKGERVYPGCVETWEQRNTTRVL